MTSDTSALARPRRNREQIEALAADFVNSSLRKKVAVQLAGPAAVRVPRAAMVAGAAVLAACAVAFLVWPEPEAAAPSREAIAAAQEAQQWAQRVEAERERQRKQLQSGHNYLSKMASADSALLADMGRRAQALESRPEPSQRAEVASTAAAPKPAPEPATEPAAQPREAAPVKNESPAPQVVEVAAVEAPSCDIHVSELSSSGKLTYADVARMKGARTDGNGHVFTPPVPANGRTVVFEVMPSGCVRIARKR